MNRAPQILGKALLAGVSAMLSLLVVESAIRFLDLAPALREAVETPAWEEMMDPGLDQAPQATSSVRVPHPYTGWTHRPGVAGNNIFGLPSDYEDFRQLPDEDFVIAITGGSVALGVVRRGGSALVSQLEARRPDLEDRVRIVPLALGGFKQPQHFIQMMQMLVLGVPLDAVVNIDGFNELALGGRDSRRGFHPFLPAERYWSLTLDLAANSLTPDQLRQAAAALADRERVDATREWVRAHRMAGRSQLIRSLLGLRIVRAEARAAQAEQQMATSEDRAPAPVVEALTDPCTEERTLCTELISDIWVRSSLGMHSLAEAAGIPYVHILQPNQYVQDSKTLTEHELEVAWAPDHAWSRAAAAGYPTLIDRGRELTRLGVAFHDLTGLFQEERQDIYSDTCCHYNETGYTLVAQEIANYLLAALDRRQN